MPIERVGRGSVSPHAARVWRGRTSGVETMTSVATTTRELVFWEKEGIGHAAVRGPETEAATVDVAGDSKSFGITFAQGTTMPRLPAAELVAGQRESPHVTEHTFVLAGRGVGRSRTWTMRNCWCRSSCTLGSSPVTRSSATWCRAASRESVRSVQRRVAAATGLTQGVVRQIQRPGEAVVLLGERTAALDVMHLLGHYDQPHLTRSLQRFIARTATQLRQPEGSVVPLSLLYKSGSPAAPYVIFGGDRRRETERRKRNV